MNEQIAFLTTIFPMKEEYLYDFFNSLNNQTFKDFDLVVLNDNYPNFDLIRKQFKSLRIKEIMVSDTPLRNRQYGLDFVKASNYDIIIFGDSDDYFSRNRVEVTVKKLKSYDMVVNDLSVFNADGVYEEKYFSNRIKNNAEITIEVIKDKNIFGMSNTALRVKHMGNIFYDPELIALDWYIFSLALLNSGLAIFTNEAETFYRQHDKNTVGIGRLNKETFRRGVGIKLKHYELLSREYKQFRSLLKEMHTLNKKVRSFGVSDTSLKGRDPYPFWWEEIK